MGMIKVYRIERNGVGPYRQGLNTIRSSVILAMLNKTQGTHEPIGKLMRQHHGIDIKSYPKFENYRCAFTSMKRLSSTFDHDLVEELMKIGFEVVTYEVPDSPIHSSHRDDEIWSLGHGVYYFGRQCYFDRREFEPVSRISDYETYLKNNPEPITVFDWDDPNSVILEATDKEELAND